jgi:hypothetical protein
MNSEKQITANAGTAAKPAKAAGHGRMLEHLCQAAAPESMDWLPLRFSSAFAPWIEAIASPICPGTHDPLLLEQAQIIGATTCVLGVRAERMARMERLHNWMLRYTEHAPDFQLFGRTNPKSSPQGSCRDHRTGGDKKLAGVPDFGRIRTS